MKTDQTQPLRGEPTRNDLRKLVFEPETGKDQDLILDELQKMLLAKQIESLEDMRDFFVRRAEEITPTAISRKDGYITAANEIDDKLTSLRGKQ